MTKDPASLDAEAVRLRRIAATLAEVKTRAAHAEGNLPLRRELARQLDALLAELNLGHATTT